MSKENPLRHISFKLKLLLSYIFIISIPIAAFGVFSYFSLVQSVRDNSFKSIEQIMHTEKINTEKRLDEIGENGFQISTNTILTRFFSQTNYSDISLVDAINFSIDPLLEWYRSENQKFESITFFTSNKNIPERVDIYWFDKFLKESWFKKVEAYVQGNKKYWEGCHPQRQYKFTKNRSKYVYSVFYSLLQSRYPTMTYLELEVTPEYIFNSVIDQPIGKTGGMLILYNNTPISLLRSVKVKNFYQSPEFQSFLQSSAINYQVRINKIDYYLYKEKIERLNTYLVAYVPVTEITASFSKSKYIFIGLLALALTLLCIISLLITNILTKRIKRIVGAVRKIQTGDFTVSLKEDGKDEIGELASDINIMAEKIDHLFNKVYKTELVQKDLELNVLQSQINPHFIFNSLETFKMMAEINNQEEISDGLTMLGSLIRYNTSIGRKFTNIRAEISNMDNYIKIQNLLLNNRIKIEYYIDTELYEYTIPTFILQPIVENCITHGFTNMEESLEIHITIARESSIVSFYVKDNGIGIPEEKLVQVKETLSRVNDPDFKPEGSSNIALVNINRRIKLLFGNEYGVDINNGVDSGTIICLKIPFTREAE